MSEANTEYEPSSDSHCSLEMDEPLILLGRGGSGTRLLSGLASSCGAFLGNTLNISGDSMECVADIYDLAIESTTFGGDVASSRDAYWRDRLRETAGQILARAASPPGAVWGWKLPETMLALPQVLRAFPRARIIHLVRHPLTSALRRTHMTSRMDNPIGRAVLPAAYRSCGLDPDNIEADETYLHNAATWSYQIGNAWRALDESRLAKRVLQVRYEEACANPSVLQGEIAKFLGTEPPTTSEAPAIDWTRVNRVDHEDEKVERIWSICKATAALVGYCEEGVSL